MRVCVFTHTFPRFKKDVAAPFMDGVAASIQKAGNDVYVLTPFSPLFKKTKLPYKLITYKYIYPDMFHKLGYSETLSDDKRLKPLAILLSPLMFLFGALALYKLVKKEKIDIINAHWILPNGFIACVVGKITGVPVVSTLPGSDVYMADRNIVFRLMARFATHASSAVTSNSPQLIRDLKKLTGVTQNKFYPIIYGVDPSKFVPIRLGQKRIRKQLNIRSDEKVVVGVGRLVAKKGFRYLVKAAPLILNKFSKVVFVIVGDGDERDLLDGMVKKYKVEDSFRFTGSINYKDLIYYYNLADVFILPSVRDEKGNLDDQSVSVIEAMACGKPIITTNFPGYRLVVDNGVNGYLVPQKNPVKIAESIKKILGSVSLRKKMGKKSREAALKKHSWRQVGIKYSELFKRSI